MAGHLGILHAQRHGLGDDLQSAVAEPGRLAFTLVAGGSGKRAGAVGGTAFGSSRSGALIGPSRRRATDPDDGLVAGAVAAGAGLWLLCSAMDERILLFADHLQRGWHCNELAGPLSAFAVAVNIIGNLLGGFAVQRRIPVPAVMVFAALIMASTSWLAFGSGASFEWRYGAVVVLSLISGMIPGSLFSTAPKLAPDPGAISTTVGLMQQGSSAGQVIAPPLIAALATATGGWNSSWWVTGLFAIGNIVAAVLLIPVLARVQSRSSLAASSSLARDS